MKRLTKYFFLLISFIIVSGFIQEASLSVNELSVCESEQYTENTDAERLNEKLVFKDSLSFKFCPLFFLSFENSKKEFWNKSERKITTLSINFYKEFNHSPPCPLV